MTNPRPPGPPITPTPSHQPASARNASTLTFHTPARAPGLGEGGAPTAPVPRQAALIPPARPDLPATSLDTRVPTLPAEGVPDRSDTKASQPPGPGPSSERLAGQSGEGVSYHASSSSAAVEWRTLPPGSAAGTTTAQPGPAPEDERLAQARLDQKREREAVRTRRAEPPVRPDAGSRLAPKTSHYTRSFGDWRMGYYPVQYSSRWADVTERVKWIGAALGLPGGERVALQRATRFLDDLSLRDFMESDRVRILDELADRLLDPKLDPVQGAIGRRVFNAAVKSVTGLMGSWSKDRTALQALFSRHPFAIGAALSLLKGAPATRAECLKDLSDAARVLAHKKIDDSVIPFDESDLRIKGAVKELLVNRYAALARCAHVIASSDPGEVLEFLDALRRLQPNQSDLVQATLGAVLAELRGTGMLARTAAVFLERIVATAPQDQTPADLAMRALLKRGLPDFRALETLARNGLAEPQRLLSAAEQLKQRILREADSLDETARQRAQYLSPLEKATQGPAQLSASLYSLEHFLPEDFHDYDRWHRRTDEASRLAGHRTGQTTPLAAIRSWAEAPRAGGSSPEDLHADLTTTLAVLAHLDPPQERCELLNKIMSRHGQHATLLEYTLVRDAILAWDPPSAPAEDLPGPVALGTDPDGLEQRRTEGLAAVSAGLDARARAMHIPELLQAIATAAQASPLGRPALFTAEFFDHELAIFDPAHAAPTRRPGLPQGDAAITAVLKLMRTQWAHPAPQPGGRKAAPR